MNRFLDVCMAISMTFLTLGVPFFLYGVAFRHEGAVNVAIGFGGIALLIAFCGGLILVWSIAL